MAELWYFTCEGKQMEPVTSAELKQLAVTGFLRPTDMVWKEGMAQWVKAGGIKGLFPPGTPTSPNAIRAKSDTVPMPMPTRPRNDAVDDDDDRPRRRRRDVDEEDEEDERPRRKRRREKAGMSGLMLGLIIGGCVLAGMIVVGGILFAVLRGGRSGTIATYTFDIGPSQFHSRTFHFQTGTLYEFKVNSDKNTDVDLAIENPPNARVAHDISIGPNSYLQWSPTVSGQFHVKVLNLDMAQGNRSHVVIRAIGKSNGPVGNIPPGMVFQPNFPNPVIAPKIPRPRPPGFPVNQPPGFPGNPQPNAPINGPTDKVEVGILQPGADWETTITYKEAKQIDIRVDSDIRQCDVDLFVRQNNRHIASDTRISSDCRVTFQAQPNIPYRFLIRNLGPQATNCSITYTQP